MRHTPRWRVTALLLLVTLAGGAGCGTRPADHSAQWTPWADPSASGPATPGPMSAPPTSGSPVRPSATSGPTRSPSATTRTVDWYLAHLPSFPPPPAPKPVTFNAMPGRTPWVSRVSTTQQVAFLTIDDGWIQRPEAVRMLRAAGIPVTLFLTVNAVKSNPAYFQTLQRNGAVVEAHTISHRRLTELSYADQKHEICGSADWLGTRYGRRPVLFRPPYGEKNDDTLRAAYDCGLRASFFWSETVDKGRVYYQTAEKRVHAGDIILMHFREAFAADFYAALQAIKAAGLTPALLENYVGNTGGDG